jgi:2-hydroxychromene-2-carboxylate isomerase
VKDNTVAHPIESFFDFSSPYGYIATHRIEEIAKKHRREVLWKPFLLGAIFKVNEQRPLKDQALKWDYSSHVLDRLARLYGIAWQLPDHFQSQPRLQVGFFIGLVIKTHAWQRSLRCWSIKNIFPKASILDLKKL